MGVLRLSPQAQAVLRFAQEVKPTSWLDDSILFWRICNPPETSIGICNAAKRALRDSNPYIPCGRIANPTEQAGSIPNYCSTDSLALLPRAERVYFLFYFHFNF